MNPVSMPNLILPRVPRKSKPGEPCSGCSLPAHCQLDASSVPSLLEYDTVLHSFVQHRTRADMRDLLPWLWRVAMLRLTRC